MKDMKNILPSSALSGQPFWLSSPRSVKIPRGDFQYL